MKALLFLLFASLLLGSCQNTPPSPARMVLVNTPAEVAQQWIEAFYNDDFTTAGHLSTATTKMMIDSVKKEMEPNAATIAFTISNMSCQTKVDSALCTYTYLEEEGRFEEYVNLLKVKGQWLVDESWDNSSDIEQEFDLIREEVEKLLREEAAENIQE